jgi:hypothetical protein
LARVKAIFDADILIHLVKTNAIEFAIETLGILYIGDFVYQQEIKKDSLEGKKIEKLKNSRKIQIIEFNSLTDVQKKVYRETYKLLKREEISEKPQDNPINEGERITASYAKACNIFYYMSDDNKASSHIRSLASVDIVNYCEILFLHVYIYRKLRIEELRKSYGSFVDLYDKDKIPRILKNKGVLRTFEEMMAVSYDKFHSNSNLKRLLDNAKENSGIKEVAVDKDK